mgnify:CR=1 FL=1|jgi:hypothetical protein
MSINKVNITNERNQYCVHLDNEDDLLFLVPIESDDSENWTRLQAWLDESVDNGIVDDMPNQDIHYQVQRRQEYPNWAEQLDYIYHNGVDSWKENVIDPIKARYPKPE